MHARLVAHGLTIVMAWSTVAWGKGPIVPTTGVQATPINLVTRGCGSVAELNARVARRSRQIRLVLPSGPCGLEAEILDLDGDRKEIVWTVVKTGERFSRRMRAQTCDEALEALALLTVLTLDPAAAAPPRQEPRTESGAPDDLSSHRAAKTSKRATAMVETAPPSADRGDSGTTSPRKTSGEGNTPIVTSDSVDAARPANPANPAKSDTAEPGVSVVLGNAIPKAAEPEADVDVGVHRNVAPPASGNDARGPRRGVLSVGAGGIVIGGPAPLSLAGASVYAVWGWNRDSPWSPAVTLAAGHSERNGLSFPGGTANFSLDAVQLEVCPVWLGMRRRLGARACALGMMGALAVRGVQTMSPQNHRRFFALFGGSLAVIYQAASRVELVASGGFAFPLQHYAFQFEPRVFYRVETVSMMGGVGVGFRFH